MAGRTVRVTSHALFLAKIYRHLALMCGSLMHYKELPFHHHSTKGYEWKQWPLQYNICLLSLVNIRAWIHLGGTASFLSGVFQKCVNYTQQKQPPNIINWKIQMVILNRITTGHFNLLPIMLQKVCCIQANRGQWDHVVHVCVCVCASTPPSLSVGMKDWRQSEVHSKGKRT